MPEVVIESKRAEKWLDLVDKNLKCIDMHMNVYTCILFALDYGDLILILEKFF